MPDAPAQNLLAKTRGLIGLQLAAGFTVAAGFFVVDGPWQAASAVYGAAISVLMTALLSSGVSLAGRVGTQHPGRGQAVLYAGAAVRFVLVLALFGLGLAVARFAPVAIVVGFIAAQAMTVVSALRRAAAG